MIVFLHDQIRFFCQQMKFKTVIGCLHVEFLYVISALNVDHDGTHYYHNPFFIALQSADVLNFITF